MATTDLENADLAGLETQIAEMANAQFDSPHFRRFLALKFTKARAQTYIIQRTHWTTNRRCCWAHAQGSAPLDVKTLIWEHEREELEGKPEIVALNKCDALTRGFRPYPAQRRRDHLHAGLAASRDP